MTAHRRLRSKAVLGFILLAVSSILFSAPPPSAGRESAYSFHNPFHPEQCGQAIARGRAEVARDASSDAARMLLAEGLLCRGLEDDPASLDGAIALFRRIVREAPPSFYAQLELADALRRRFPLSNEALSQLRRARAMVETASVGAAREDLVAYMDENLAAMEAHRVRSALELGADAASYAAGTISAGSMAGYVSLLAQTGPDGVAQAARSLDAFLARHDDSGLATLYRAEILRGQIAPARLRALYAQAVAELCGKEGHDSRCALARWRLAQLDRQLKESAPDRAQPASAVLSGQTERRRQQ